jgi:hypothetical protein
MVLASLLEQSRESSDGFQFTVKGGVALELRLRDRARATKDIDLVLHHEEADLARALERAVNASARGGHQGFTYRRKGEPTVLENRTISVEFAVTYEGGTWTSIIIDVARAEPGEGEIELLPAVLLQEATGITGPAEPLVIDYAALRHACESVFRTRGTHAWPPVLELPSHWAEPVAALARELDLPVQDGHEAMERVQAFVDRIRMA